jgi:hypothetical protein
MQEQTDSAKIERLLKRAAEYAAHSVTHVISKLDDGHAPPRKVFYDCLGQMHELEVHFLFPNLSEKQRDLLVELLNARRSLMTGLSKAVHRPSASGKKRQDTLLTQLKRHFIELQGRAEKFRDETNLTPFQKQILEREFLGLPHEV